MTFYFAKLPITGEAEPNQNLNMTDEEIRNTAIHALDWAKGSWGQSSYSKPPYEDETMAKIWYQIADIARDRAIKFDCDYVAKTELK